MNLSDCDLLFFFVFVYSEGSSKSIVGISLNSSGFSLHIGVPLLNGTTGGASRRTGGVGLDDGIGNTSTLLECASSINLAHPGPSRNYLSSLVVAPVL